MYKRYERYKDSGIEWIGEIPEHWETKSFRNLIQFLRNGTTASQSDEAMYMVTRIESISNGYIDINSVGYIDKFNGIEKYKLEKGDVLFSHINSLKIVGNCAIFEYDNLEMFNGMNLLQIRATNNTCSRWLYYLIKSYYFNQKIKAIAKHAINQVSVPTSRIKSIEVIAPVLDEQKAIANFLDHKTSEIDSLIADKEKLIERLEEYKQSIITEAVTKGLNPDVKMKDSGIEWIREIPEHWSILSLKRLARFKSGDSISSDEIESEGEYPVYGGNNIRGYTTSYTHDGNYILIGRQGALCGNINYANGKFWASEHAVVVYPLNNIATKWFGELLRIMDLNKYSISAAQPGISLDNIVQLPIPVPPVKEQYEIANYLDNEFYSIDSLINKVKDAINKLKQHRQSLIYEAVTGKIDVREYEPERSEQLA